MRLDVQKAEALRFGDGSPVRAASAVTRFGDGVLVVQDDATHAAWVRPGSVERVRVLDPVGGLDVFSSAAGTKHLKPDLEAACVVAGGAALLLGSGSSPARMRASLVTLAGTRPRYTVADLTPLYQRIAAALGLRAEQLNLEGACPVGDRLRWFQRGNTAAGAPTACVDVDLPALLTAATGGSAERVAVHGVRRYELGGVDGVALAVTDAVALPGGRVLVSAAAEDTPNAVDDGPVVGAALALLDDDAVLAVAALPEAYKVEGLAVLETAPWGVRLLAVVDADDPEIPSQQLTVRVELP